MEDPPATYVKVFRGWLESRACIKDPELLSSEWSGLDNVTCGKALDLMNSEIVTDKSYPVKVIYISNAHLNLSERERLFWSQKSGLAVPKDEMLHVAVAKMRKGQSCYSENEGKFIFAAYF